ncbi:MAG: hypothetical protein HN769_17550 [Anaerolineae bacterium]|nr:hypothetical protein [Anaerolineae bacterium]
MKRRGARDLKLVAAHRHLLGVDTLCILLTPRISLHSFQSQHPSQKRVRRGAEHL